ncbi:transposase, partial [Streptomyces niveus]
MLYQDVEGEPFLVASRYRDDLFACLTARGDELFELVDALLCADGPVTAPVDLTLVAEHRRGHDAMYDALNSGNVDAPRLRQVLAGLPMPQAADGRLVLAVDVSNWLRPVGGSVALLPVSAGMAPREPSASATPAAAPCACGDGPGGTHPLSSYTECSPRVRGWPLLQSLRPFAQVLLP